MQPRCVQIVFSATSLFSTGWRLTIQNPSLPAGVFLKRSSTEPGMPYSTRRPTRQFFFGSFNTLGLKKSWNIAPNVAPTAAIAPQATTSARFIVRRDTLPFADARRRSPIDICGAYAPPAARTAMRWSGGALRQSTPCLSTARTISSPWLISGLRRTVVARFAESDGLILLVLSRAWNFGSGGAGGATIFAAGALATTSAPAAAGEPSGWFAHGAGPSTSFVSNLMTSTGQPSAATMIDGVSGRRKSGLCAGGRIRQVSSVTSNTSGQSFSHASQTMQPGAIQTLVMI